MDFFGEGVTPEGGGKVCMVCTRFGIRPAAPAVDPSGESTDDADRLCRTHRIRVMRGYCFLCGIGRVWVSPFEDPSIGCCRRCLVERQGIHRARWIEHDLDQEDEGEVGAGDSPWRQN